MSIRKAYQETTHSGSVMSPVHVITQGDWTLYWRLTLKLKRKGCYILVLYRKVLHVMNRCNSVTIMLGHVTLFGLDY